MGGYRDNLKGYFVLLLGNGTTTKSTTEIYKLCREVEHLCGPSKGTLTVLRAGLSCDQVVPDHGPRGLTINTTYRRALLYMNVTSFSIGLLSFALYVFSVFLFFLFRRLWRLFWLVTNVDWGEYGFVLPHDPWLPVPVIISTCSIW